MKLNIYEIMNKTLKERFVTTTYEPVHALPALHRDRATALPPNWDIERHDFFYNEVMEVQSVFRAAPMIEYYKRVTPMEGWTHVSVK